MMLDVLLYSGNIWLIIGLVLAILELTNGSLIFFLPTGASGMITGLILKLQENGSLPGDDHFSCSIPCGVQAHLIGRVRTANSSFPVRSCT